MVVNGFPRFFTHMYYIVLLLVSKKQISDMLGNECAIVAGVHN